MARLVAELIAAAAAVGAQADRGLINWSLTVVDKMTTRPIGAEAGRVEGATEFRLILWMSS